MTCPALLSWEDFRDTQRRAAMRPRRHDRCDCWLTPLEDRRQAPSPTLAALTQAVVALRQERTQAVTEGVVEHTHGAALAQRTAVCPQCGPMWAARGPQDRTVETLVGRFDGGARTLTVSAAKSAPPRGTRRGS